MFELDRDIIKLNILIEFNEHWRKTVASKGLQGLKVILPSDLVFDPPSILKLVQDIIKANILVKFHENKKKHTHTTHIQKKQKKNKKNTVASRGCKGF